MCVFSPQLNQLFQDTNRSLHKVHETNLGHRHAMKQFKSECLEAGLVDSMKCSIEDCIGGLKEALEIQKQELMVSIVVYAGGWVLAGFFL